MNSSPIVLVETSVQIERLLGATRQQSALAHHLATADHQFVSSHYVFMEFQRAVLADFVRVHNAILQHDNWEAAAQALRSSVLAYRPRSLGRCMQILTRCMVLSHLDRSNALDLLRVQLRYDLPNRFWQPIQPLADPIVCDLVGKGVTRRADEQYEVADACRKERAACFLPDFLAGHRNELYAITTYLTAHPHCLKNQARVVQLLSAVLNDPRSALGQSACWPLGDVIIALQALPDAMIWTLDADFAPLTQALGLKLYRPEGGAD